MGELTMRRSARSSSSAWLTASSLRWRSQSMPRDASTRRQRPSPWSAKQSGACSRGQGQAEPFLRPEQAAAHAASRSMLNAGQR
jgi:hypothetical protein